MNWSLLANSFLVASASTFLALLFGFTVAIALTILPKFQRQLLMGLTMATLGLPSFVATNCWIDLLGTGGILHPWLPLNIFSFGGAVWLLALLLWPIPALFIWSAWQVLETFHFEVEPALRGVKLCRFLLWRAARAHLGLSAAVVFALALNNFAVPTILQVKVFTSEMWVQFNANLDAVGTLLLGWPLVLVPVFLLFFLSRTQFSWPREMLENIAPIARRQMGPAWTTLIIIATGIILALSLLTPLAQIVLTPRTWQELLPALSAGRGALTHSFVYAAGATALALLIGLLVARVRHLDWLWLAFFIPGVLLGIAALTIFNRPGLDFFSRTAAIVIAVLVARYLALAHSIGRAAFLSVDGALIDSARLDGARGFTLFRRAVLPQIRAQVAAAGYIVYVLCLWDVETILLVIPPGGETLALRVFNLLHYGHNAHVNALCLLLLLLALAPLTLFAGWKTVSRS